MPNSIAQLNEQQYEYLKPKTAQERIHPRFWHPQGRHDDRLFALASPATLAEDHLKGNVTYSCFIKVARNPTTQRAIFAQLL